MSKVPFKINK